MPQESWTATARTDAVFRDGAISFSPIEIKHAERFCPEGGFDVSGMGDASVESHTRYRLLARAENSVQTISA